MQIADDLREQIRTGRIAVGTRLQSQTDLAKEYGVVPNTLRAALRELASEGLISTRSTRGTFVLKKPEPQLRDLVRQLTDRVDSLEARIVELERDDHQQSP